MERYLAGEDVDAALLVGDLERAVARGSFHPVVPVDCSTGVGARELLDLVVAGFPSPLEHPLPDVYTPAGKPGPDLRLRPRRPAGRRGGEDDHRRVRRTGQPGAGVLRHRAARRDGARLGAPLAVRPAPPAPGGPRGPRRGRADRRAVGAARQDPAARPTAVVAGDICAIGRLSRAETGDTLSDPDRPLVLRPWTCPRRCCRWPSRPGRKADEDKLGQGLARLAAEDPTLRIEHNAETHQIVLWTMGEAHVDVLLDRLEHRHGVAVDQVRAAGAAARDVRRAGRRATAGTSSSPAGTASTPCATSRWSRCPGGGFEFVDKVVGGAVPRQFIPSVEKGLRAQMERGVAAGLPGRRHPGDADRRQVAQRRLLRHGLPDGRRRWRCGRPRPRPHRAARAGRRGRRPHSRRAGRRGDERPVGATRAGPRQRAGRAAAAPWCAPRCRRWRSAATPSTCGPCPTARPRSPATSSATSRCPTPRRSSQRRPAPVAPDSQRNDRRRAGHASEASHRLSAPGTRASELDSARVTRGAARAASREREVRLAVVDQLVVGLLAHQLDQLGAVADVDRLRRRRAPRCCRCSTSRGRGRPDPSRAGRTPRS